MEKDANSLTYQASQHLEHQSTKTPPINALSVAISFQDFRGCLKIKREFIETLRKTRKEGKDTKIFRSSTKSGGSIIVAEKTFFRNPKVGHTNMTVIGQQQILWL